MSISCISGGNYCTGCGACRKKTVVYYCSGCAEPIFDGNDCYIIEDERYCDLCVEHEIAQADQ